MTDPNPFPERGALPRWCTAFGRAKPPGSYFDKQAADWAIEFFDTYLHHTQGPLAGEAFHLAPEQEWVTREAFGWMRADGRRLVRTVYVEEPRAMGKSQWGAGIAGKLLCADGESDPEIVGAAVDRKQARIILNRLKAMMRMSPELSKRATPLRGEIRYTSKTGGEGWYEATSSDVASAWGGAPHGVIFDEVHAQKSRELWDALITGTGKRRQPMVWAFTTAGWDHESLCWELHEYTRQGAEGSLDDPSFLGVVWAAPEDADWTLPETWRMANPLLEAEAGTGLAASGARAAVSLDFLERECERAKAIPAFSNTFRTMYLSQWVGQETRFIPMDMWDLCGEPVRPGKRAAFGGLDLASTTDLAAYAVVSLRDDKVEVDLRVFAPADGLRERVQRDRVPYDVWAREGLLTLTPGRTIRQEAIRQAVLESAGTYDLKDVGYDPWNASELVVDLESDGVQMVQLRQGFSSMSAPTKELLRLVLDQKLRHGGHPILRWMVDNTAPQTDAAGNVKPDKSRSTGRIDGLVASVMAVDGLMRRGRAAKRRSVYEDRGVLLA